MRTVSLSLDPSGQLRLALPGAEGDRFIILGPGHELETIFRILHAKDEGIGTDGAPTAAQVRHWEKHQIFYDDRCPFCAEEKLSRKHERFVTELAKRFVAEGGTITGKIKDINLDELGL